MVASELEQILKHISQQNLPPVHLWNPAFTAQMDMRIAADGSWYYQGSKIQRQRMVKLFSTILKKEAEKYYLVTPVEKYLIKVDDAPFVALEVDKIMADQQVLVFRTNVGDKVIADSAHQIKVITEKESSQPRPYIHVRDGLNALIHRNVFYQLVEWAQQTPAENATVMSVQSRGHEFILGQF